MPIESEKPDLLSSHVANVVLQKILQGDLRAGERIVEITLARELGVAHSVVREALIELKHRGYVQRVPRKGTCVANPKLDSVRKMFRVRTEWEILAARLILERFAGRELDLTGAERAVDDMVASWQQGNSVAYSELDLRFHRELWKLADNEYLSGALENLGGPIFAFFVMQLHKLDGPDDPQARWRTVTLHKAILRSLRDRSMEKVRDALSEHESHAFTQVYKQLERPREPSSEVREFADRPIVGGLGPHTEMPHR